MATSPLSFRKLLREGKIPRNTTYFECKGYIQANFIAIPKKYAEDFANFAKGNIAPLPVLYRSKVGEFSAPPLCEDSNICTDVPLYDKLINGHVAETIENLLDYDLSEYVFFYIGCSTSFSDILISHGILKDSIFPSNSSMYETNINCYPCGVFQSKLVVCMRAIPASKLSLTATLSHPLTDLHGGPIHFGNPKLIGIDDIQKAIEYETKFDDDCIPVFWACGVTGIYALKSAKVELAFSHCPGYMFITDIVQNEGKFDKTNLSLICDVIKYNDKSSSYSTLSRATLQTLENIYSIVKEDPMQRGIENLVVSEDFTKSALALSHASSVALITGFPCCDTDPHDETDGLPGIISLVAALQLLGKSVVLVVDDHTLAMNISILAKLVAEGCLTETIEVVPYADGQTKLKDSDGKPLYDVVLSSERVGRSKDGHYYTMKGKDISSLVTPIDNFFAEATDCEDVTTISVGDGGNELGMGKVYDKVCQHIHLGEKIACNVSADLLISAGVSNWGCYGLGLALYSLLSCSIHERYLRKGIGFPFENFEQMKNLLPAISKERKTLEVIESFGIKDGRKPNQKLSVDAMFFDREHTDVLKRMRSHAGLA